MTRLPIYHAAFWEDVLEACKWLESRRAGYAAEFSNEVEDAVRAVLERPESFRIMFDEIRRALISRFHYVVLFEIWPEGIFFYGVLHGMRDIESWLVKRTGA